MARLNVAPTRSNLLSLRRQLAFAEEGYDLLEQKRQVLVYELLGRMNEVAAVEARVTAELAKAFAALLEAELDAGSLAVDRAALGVQLDHRVEVLEQRLLGLRIPRVAVQTQPPGAPVGLLGTSAHADDAMARFVALLPLLGRRAELESAVRRLARELRKTQRRCNALSRVFIPSHRETIAYVLGVVEERERESLVILKLIRNRLAQSGGSGPG